MRSLFLIITLLSLYSCQEEKPAKVSDFRTGSFKTVLDDRQIVSTAWRNDSVQIETYSGKKDTFAIRWVDPFEYVLVKTNPRTLLDSTPFHVKITSIKRDSYTFRAYYRGSNFKQTGTAFKLDQLEEN